MNLIQIIGNLFLKDFQLFFIGQSRQALVASFGIKLCCIFIRVVFLLLKYILSSFGNDLDKVFTDKNFLFL